MPDAPCTALLEPEDWPALAGAMQVTATPPATPPSLRQAVHGMGRLGGFLARRGDGDPGVTVWWKGLPHLTDLTFMYRIMRPLPAIQQHGGKISPRERGNRSQCLRRVVINQGGYRGE